MNGSSSTIRSRVSIACPRLRGDGEEEHEVLLPGSLATLQELAPVQRYELLGHRPLDTRLRRTEERGRLVRLAELEPDLESGIVPPDAALDRHGHGALRTH